MDESGLVLVVDDEDGIREMFKDAVEEIGLRCVTAASGEAALHLLAERPADVAVLDVVMPGMSGLTLFERIRELHPAAYVIFVTALDDIDLAVQRVRGGAHGYLVKPVSLRRLQEEVAHALRERTAAMATEQGSRAEQEGLEKSIRDMSDQARSLPFPGLEGDSQRSPEELYEDRVRLKVAGGDVQEVAHFVKALRQRPELRLLRLDSSTPREVGSTDGATEPAAS
jgi:DNA-binding response OmpR family regulator